MATRTLFFHIGVWQQAGFYLLAAVAVAICAHGFWRRARLWSLGSGERLAWPRPARARELARQVLGHARTLRRRYAGRMHLGLFYGFVLLFIGTCIVAVEHYGALVLGPHWLYSGAFFLSCKVVLDLAGLALAAGVVLALARRYGRRPANLGHGWQDGAFLVLLLAATVTGLVLEAAGIAADPSRQAYARFSPVAGALAPVLGHLAPAAYAAVWWVHVPLVLGVIAALPYGRWLHLFVAPLSIAYQPARPVGPLEPVSVEQVEQTGRIGLGRVTDLGRWQLMSLDACMECGRCTDACPAHAVGKELDPKGVVLDLRRALGRVGATATGAMPGGASPPEPSSSLAGAATDGSTDVISDASLWACTNCHACVRECPVLIRHVDLLEGIRRYRVAEGRLAGTAATTLRQIASRDNPWGLPASQRMDWAKGLDVPQASAGDGREVLFWVGCAGAFDPRAQRTTRAVAALLERAGVRYAVLGARERCTGDPARRIGDEFAYQQLVEANIAALHEVGATTIVTQCAHCHHTLKTEYPDFGGRYEVWHHTQYLASLIADGRLQVDGGAGADVAYHDPCFLARVNGETAAPRAALRAAGVHLREPEKSKDRTFCCGAGGGRMWMDEPPNQRPGLERARQLLATGAQTVAIGCPFCKTMLSDSLLQIAGDNVPRVTDVAEVLAAAAGIEVLGAPVQGERRDG